MNEEPTFKNYKERQNYYKERYKNRGKTIWLSKVVDPKTGKVLQNGNTYTKKGVFKVSGRTTK